MAHWKRKYWQTRKAFKQELYEIVKDNPVYVPMIAETYVASKLRTHIHKIWWMARNHNDFLQEYNRNLMGKMLTGTDEILINLSYADERFNKYRGKIPKYLAMGDAYAIMIRVQREGWHSKHK
ncbi:MAG TPA: hypothetical protein GXZ90_01930 [Clostridiales bacterium]|nr:hypothetical protein [Clostridiales bacterium]